MIIEISEHGSVLKRNHECFVIITPIEKREIPAEKIDSIIITGNALISTSAISLCLEREIQLVIAIRSGEPLGRFWASTPGKATEIRRKQYLNQNTKLAFDISKEIVTIKLNEQKKLLTDLKNNRTEENPIITNSIKTIGKTLESLNQLKYSTKFKQSLLGLEGFAASEYFKAISVALPEKYAFNERTRNPATDPFNAVLNYLYGFGYATVEKVIIVCGLDPNAGIYHQDSYGKPTLSFDLIELSRPKLDRLAVKVFSKKIASDDWFEKSEETGGIFLSKQAKKAIIAEYFECKSKDIEKQTWSYCRKIIKLLQSDEL